MKTITDIEPVIQQMPVARPTPNLILHCGAKAVTRQEVEISPTPNPTETWMPIPHTKLIEEVEFALNANGLAIGSQAHSLTREGARYFGLMEIQRQDHHMDYCWVLGVRNSHDRSFPAAVTAGASVFVRDNLSFSGEVKLSRKHTRFIMRDIPGLVQLFIGKLMNQWHSQDTRIAAHKNSELTHKDAHDLLIRASDVGICPPQSIPHVLKEWRVPRHAEFRSHNVWSFFNALTEILKGNLYKLPRRTEALHGLLDNHVGLAN